MIYFTIIDFLFNLGDCDNDTDCLPGLKCGVNNCPNALVPSFDITDDCCFNPATSLEKSEFVNNNFMKWTIYQKVLAKPDEMQN